MTGAGVVVVGFDGSEDATSALAWAAGAARAMGTSLCIVHAVGLLEHAGMAGSHVDGAAAVRLAEDAGLDPGSVEWRVVDGDPCSALLRVAAGPDPAVLIVVGSPRCGWPRRNAPRQHEPGGGRACRRAGHHRAGRAAPLSPRTAPGEPPEATVRSRR